MKQPFALLTLVLLPHFCQAQDSPKTSPYDSAHFSLFKPVPRRLLRELQPDRPGITDNPFTVDAGHVQLELDAFRLINNRESQDPRERELHVGYSIIKVGLSRRTDFHVELPLHNVVKTRPAETKGWQERQAGFGDVTLRLKHNFLGDKQDGSFAMAAIGYACLATGGAVGSGAPEYGLTLPTDLELSNKANLEIQLQTDLLYDRNAARRYVRLLPGAALEYDFTEKFGVVSEAVAQWNTLERRWQASLNFAPILMLTDDLQFDLGTHVPLNSRSEQHYFVGVTVRH